MIRELMQQLHRLTQKDLFVEQYRKKNGVVNVKGRNSQRTIAHFQSVLNLDIRRMTYL